MSTFLRDQLQANLVNRIKDRARKAWGARQREHQQGQCNCPVCQLRRAGGVRVVSLTDLLGRNDDASEQTADPAKKLQ